MMVRVYGTRAEANAAVAALGAARYDHRHREGLGPDDYAIAAPGNAAARIRARGVFTDRAVAVLTDRLSRPCVPVPRGQTDPLAVDFDDGREAIAEEGARVR